MGKEKTINLLAACKPLAVKLAEQGVDIELTPQEQKVLDSFKQIEVGFIELLFDHDIQQLTGLSCKDIKNLNYIVARDFISKVQFEHRVIESSL